MLVLQFDAKHGVGQRLNHRGHHFNGVLFRISRIALRLIVMRPFCHALLCVRTRNVSIHQTIYQTGPDASFGRVKIHGPFSVTATVCSKCAESPPSAVTAVHLSSSTRTAGLPVFTMGSMARTIPACNFGPWPGSP